MAKLAELNQGANKNKNAFSILREPYEYNPIHGTGNVQILSLCGLVL